MVYVSDITEKTTTLLYTSFTVFHFYFNSKFLDNHYEIPKIYLCLNKNLSISKQHTAHYFTKI